MSITANTVVVAAYGQGTAGIAELRQKLSIAWKQVLADPVQLHAAADTLKIPADVLVAAEIAPVQLEVGQAGISGVELAIIVSLWFGDRVLLRALEDLAKDEVKRRVSQLWSSVLEPAFRRQFRDHFSLGSETKPK